MTMLRSVLRADAHSAADDSQCHRPFGTAGCARYTATAVVLHWVIAALLIAEFAHGWWMQVIPKEPPGIRADAFNMHKSFGLVLLALALLRLGWRLAHRPPPFPPMPRWQAIAARANHVLLYTMMLAMPLSGYFGSVFSGYPIKWFGMALPAWSGAIWQFGCPQLGVIKGHFATRDDALLAGIAMIVRRPTQRGDLAA